MRWSQAFIPTLRDDPTDAEAISHRLLVRGGYLRQLMAGAYSLLPLMIRVRAKVAAVIREEMDRIGGQEFLLPAVHPAEIWQKSGRWEIMGDEMFRLRDRKGADLALGMTHEEIFSTLALELRSYRDLPQFWYQIQTKFRDEPRPKGGVLRTREFTMKDSYSFDMESAGLDASFDRHFEAYERIFARLGLDAVPVEASSGAMGGSDSIEFMVRSKSGEDDVVFCGACGYAANMERATSRIDAIEDGAVHAEVERFATPGVRTILDLATFEGGAAKESQVKSLVYMIGGEPTLVLLRGDHALVEQKLQDGTGAIDIRPAHPEEIQAALGANPGSLGAVGVKGIPILADQALAGRFNMVTGANQDEFHLRGVDVERDIEVTTWMDMREITDGEACVTCGEPLEVFKAIEVGHIFKLGTKYAEAFGVSVLDEEGAAKTVIMGSYGIGLERNIAAVVETHHDEKGIVWPVAIAPYVVVITVLRADVAEVLEAGERLYRDYQEAGIDTILDDRVERPGVKFADAELIGIPYRVTVGPRGLENGIVEIQDRAGGTAEEVAVGDAISHVIRLIAQ
ncbi:MAG: proline--tRNA ligase [Acidimicrobiia bacterium]|nr:proline--tRNA ligase [Acidimicrobiia bacterium]